MSEHIGEMMVEGFCRRCGEQRSADDVDPCLGGFIPGVSQACCGHGDLIHAYVVLGGYPNQGGFPDPERLTLRGRDAVEFFDAVRRARLAMVATSEEPEVSHPDPDLLAEAVRHVIRHGKLGKQSEARLRKALRD